MKPYKHQEVFADKCWQILKDIGYVYLAGKPRSGKTYTAILCAEKSDKVKNVLVLTKKAAISGWYKFIEDNTRLRHNYYVTNYEQVGTFKAGRYNLKLDPKAYDLVIIDESHNLGTLAKPSNRIKCIGKLCYNMPHIHLSGTAIVESPNGIFHQMSISKYNPFRFRNFYDFFRVYGIPHYIKAAGRDIQQYHKYKPELLVEIDKFTVYMTQEDAGIPKELQAVDKVHYIELDNATKKLYNTLQKDNIATICTTDHLNYGLLQMGSATLVCDSTMKLRTSLHMIEGGVAKIDGDYIELGNTEKVDYVKKVFGDNKGVGIMSHFIGERNILAKHFRHATIYSSNAHSEGVDLSHLDYFIIFSSDYSGAKFIQRRERIINTEGSNTLEVHHLLVKKAISDQVYKRVSKKQDFNNSTYEQETI
jgi:hypothetical protein